MHFLPPNQQHQSTEGREQEIAENAILLSTSVDTGGSIAEWLACWTQAQKGLD